MSEREGETYLIASKQIRTLQVEVVQAIGLFDALFLQQLQFWLSRDSYGKKKDGKQWIYNSISKWHSQFPWVTTRTIERTITSLENKGVLLSRKDMNSTPFDRTKHYAINHSKLDEIIQKVGMENPKKRNRLRQNDGRPSVKVSGSDTDKMQGTIPKITKVNNQREQREAKTAPATPHTSAKQVADSLLANKAVSSALVVKRLKHKERIMFADVRQFWQNLLSLNDLKMHISFTKQEIGMAKHLITFCADNKVDVLKFIEWSVMNWEQIRRKIVWDEKKKVSRLGPHPYMKEIGFNKEDLLVLFKGRTSSEGLGVMMGAAKSKKVYLRKDLAKLITDYPNRPDLVEMVNLLGRIEMGA